MSLSKRLTILVTALVAAALIVFVSLMTWRLGTASAHQTAAIERQMQTKFVEQLALEGRLATSFIERVGEATEASTSALAGRNETRELIERGNIVAIDLTMQRAAKSYGLDSILVLDRGSKALGSHRPGLDLLGANGAFAQSLLAPVAAALVEQNNRDAPVAHARYLTAEPEFLQATGFGEELGTQARISFVSIQPVFDEFGDVLALIVGQKVLSNENAALNKFTNSLNISVEIREGENVLMKVGGLDESRGSKFHLSHCLPFGGQRELCVLTGREQMLAQTESLVSAMVSERNELVKWVALLAVLCLVLAGLFASYMTRRVMAPLAQITGAVRSVAAGNWMARVSGQHRQDEVGEIARAVTVLQTSVKEREQLQADVADINALRDSRDALAKAIDACRAALRQKLFSVSDGGDRLALSLQRMSSLTALAEGEADETRLIGMRLVDGKCDEKKGSEHLCDAIDRLCETLSAISNCSEKNASELESLIDNLSALDRTVKTLVTEIDGLSEARPALKLAA